MSLSIESPPTGCSLKPARKACGEEAAAAAPAGGVARACAWSGAGGGGGGAGGGAAAAVDVVDDDAGRFATAARARSHHLLRCLRTLTAAQILRARCFSRSLCSLRCRRAACAAVSGLLSPPACRSAAPREPLAHVSLCGWPARCLLGVGVDALPALPLPELHGCLAASAEQQEKLELPSSRSLLRRARFLSRRVRC